MIMKDTVTVSVIIAAYNDADYIEECLDSIFSQTLKNIEVIVVDDGSEDETHIILIEYQRKYSRMIIISQSNTGAGIARNRAMKLASGKYLAFMDADDRYPCEDSIEKLYDAAETNSALLCGGNMLYNNNGIISNRYIAGQGDKRHSQNKFISKDEYYEMYGHTRYLYSTDMIRDNKIEFAPYRVFEDQILTICAINAAGKIFELDYPVYEHRVRYKIREYDDRSCLDLAKGVCDTFDSMIKFGMKEMFFVNYDKCMSWVMPLIARHIDMDVPEWKTTIDTLNNLIATSGWVKADAVPTKEKITELRSVIDTERKRINEMISDNKGVILYGAGYNTELFLKRFAINKPNIVGIAVSSKDDAVEELNGIQIKAISDYAEHRNDIPIIITPNKKYRVDIENTLISLGFKNYTWVDMNLLA